jgi:hypothetical protein
MTFRVNGGLSVGLAEFHGIYLGMSHGISDCEYGPLSTNNLSVNNFNKLTDAVTTHSLGKCQNFGAQRFTDYITTVFLLKQSPFLALTLLRRCTQYRVFHKSMNLNHYQEETKKVNCSLGVKRNILLCS